MIFIMTICDVTTMSWRCALIFSWKLTENLPEHLETPNLVQIFGRTRYAATPQLELLVAGTEKL